ncbi:hypothetical protein NPIL_280361 [Nephila pilipes]|uniref:Uncharacterized protein n=1 Tax=Nephila pilipes TaxID=299642 RepID=A0A8X6MRA2_NEPPI|nr:hypothetical protein NPIL_280361 [Nephila pilipes]
MAGLLTILRFAFDSYLNLVKTREELVSLNSSIVQYSMDMNDGEVKKHREELQEIEKEEHKYKVDALCSDSEEEREVLTSSMEIFAKWIDVNNFVGNYHPFK